MRECNIAAGVRQERTGIPGLYNVSYLLTQCGHRYGIPYCTELETLKVATPTGARKGFVDAQADSSDAVSDVHYARQFFQIGKQGGGDGAITRDMAMVGQRDLRGKD
jgi:hypothetical protein